MDLRAAYETAQELFDASELEEKELLKFKLITAGIACLEGILSVLATRSALHSQENVIIEIVTRHRLAQILYIHTQNNEYAEKVLNKAIILSSRYDLAQFRPQLQLLMSQLLIKMGHVYAASGIINSCLKANNNDLEGDVDICFVLMKVLVDPKSLEHFNILKRNSGNLTHDTKLLINIVESLWQMHEWGNFASARQLLTSLEPVAETPMEMQVLYLHSLLMAQLAYGDLKQSKGLITKMHKLLDGIDWSKWRRSVPLSMGSNVPFMLACGSDSDAMLITFLLSGIYYLSMGKISLCIRFLTQGKALAKKKQKDSVLVSLYLTLAYFTSSQWDIGYQTLLSVVHLLPNLVAHYLCGIYFQATGQLEKACESYKFVADGSQEEIGLLASLNLGVINKTKTPAEESDLGNHVQLQHYLDLLETDGSAIDIKELEDVNVQLKIMSLILISERDSKLSPQRKANISKEAYSESLKIKNWLWASISGNILHEALTDAGDVEAATSQANSNVALHHNLSKIYSKS